jgi:hypothetical protein
MDINNVIIMDVIDHTLGYKTLFVYFLFSSHDEELLSVDLK